MTITMSSAHSPFHHFTYVTTHSPKPSLALPTSQLILQPFRCFTYAQFILQPFFRFSYVTSSSLNSPGEPPMYETMKVEILNFIFVRFMLHWFLQVNGFVWNEKGTCHQDRGHILVWECSAMNEIVASRCVSIWCVLLHHFRCSCGRIDSLCNSWHLPAKTWIRLWEHAVFGLIGSDWFL